MKMLSAKQTEHLPLSDHHVVLIPGFLGFNHLGDFAYFPETVAQAIADALAQFHPARRIAVHPFETVPAGSLLERQRKLIEQLKDLRQRYPQAELHLVGHSTGGLDAELLLRTAGPNAPRDVETEAIRRAVRSLTSIAAPLAGTSLARSPLARFVAIDDPWDLARAPVDLLFLRGPSALLGGLAGVAGVLLSDRAASKLSRALLHSGAAGRAYVLSLLLDRALIDDLAPAKVRQLMAETAEDPELSDVRRARFMTIARREPKPKQAGLAGLLFRILYDHTARAARSDPEVELILQRLTARPNVRTIGVPPTPAINLQANDGIVDTVRQVLPSTSQTVDHELSRLAALVIGDHADVLGYFPGMDGEINGFLTSGSDFRKAQFNELYTAVAREIAQSIPAVRVQAEEPRESAPPP